MEYSSLPSIQNTTPIEQVKNTICRYINLMGQIQIVPMPHSPSHVLERVVFLVKQVLLGKPLVFEDASTTEIEAYTDEIAPASLSTRIACDRLVT